MTKVPWPQLVPASGVVAVIDAKQGLRGRRGVPGALRVAAARPLGHGEGTNRQADTHARRVSAITHDWMDNRHGINIGHTGWAIQARTVTKVAGRLKLCRIAKRR